jgi:hypothetical protein
MNTLTYLYSVNRKELAPSLMAACRSATFSSICGRCAIWGGQGANEIFVGDLAA